MNRKCFCVDESEWKQTKNKKKTKASTRFCAIIIEQFTSIHTCKSVNTNSNCLILIFITSINLKILSVFFVAQCTMCSLSNKQEQKIITSPKNSCEKLIMILFSFFGFKLKFYWLDKSNSSDTDVTCSNWISQQDNCQWWRRWRPNSIIISVPK